jgi:arginyl-tRNA synthetase
MLVRMDESINTRIFGQVQKAEVADQLAISAVIINDFKQKRTKGYDFSWEAALKATGDSGIKLQYTHSRLNSLLEASPTVVFDVDDLNVALLKYGQYENMPVITS